jgi:hypothetical protein
MDEFPIPISAETSLQSAARFKPNFIKECKSEKYHSPVTGWSYGCKFKRKRNPRKLNMTNKTRERLCDRINQRDGGLSECHGARAAHVYLVYTKIIYSFF